MSSSEIKLPVINLSVWPNTVDSRLGGTQLVDTKHQSRPKPLPVYRASAQSIPNVAPSINTYVQELPTVLRFDNIEAVTAALSQFPTTNDNIPIIRYPDSDNIPIISTEQYSFPQNSSNLDAEAHQKKKHFLRRDSLPQQNAEKRLTEVSFQGWTLQTGVRERFIPEKGDPTLNWTRSKGSPVELIEPRN